MFYKLLESRAEYEQQLIPFIEHSKAVQLNNAIGKRMSDVGSDIIGKRLKSLLKDEKKSHRLIGKMANVVLKAPWALFEIMDQCMNQHRNAKMRVKKEFRCSISALQTYLYSLKDIVLGLSLTSFDRKEIETMAASYCQKAKEFEYIQSFLFKKVSRTYDVIATVCVPELFKKCIDLGVSPGVLGLLEAPENYHNHVRTFPAMPYSLQYAARASTKAKKVDSWAKQVMQKIWLVNTYKESRDDTRTPVKEHRGKDNRIARSKILNLSKTPFLLCTEDSCRCKSQSNLRLQFLFYRWRLHKLEFLNKKSLSTGSSRGKKKKGKTNKKKDAQKTLRQNLHKNFCCRGGCACGRYRNYKSCNVCSKYLIENIMLLAQRCAKTLLLKNLIGDLLREKYLEQEAKDVKKQFLKLNDMNWNKYISGNLDEINI
jgi:hypothetical protein